MYCMAELKRILRKAPAYVIPIGICVLLGFIAGKLQAPAIENWYPYLHKPSLTPPNWMFPLAWGIIYLCSGISAGLVYHTVNPARKQILLLWGIQQFFNFTWSISFFVMQNALAGFVHILFLDVWVLGYVLYVWPVKKSAGILFFPYLLWLALATYLNGYILFFSS